MPSEPSGVIVDLARRRSTWRAHRRAGQGGDSSPPRIVAFGPHVHEERLPRRAMQAATEVLSRGQLLRARCDVSTRIDELRH